MAGKRLGKEDKRGILFFNSLEFIQENKPRYFIFENVKGLLSHDKVDKKAQYGKTFQEWINYLGGKSVNGVHTFFPYEDAVPYHIYFQVLNAKDYNIPQNRERIFIIGIRDDEDNDFSFPKPITLEKRLKDILETEVDEKYFLSDKMVKVLAHHQNKIVENENPNESGCIHAGYFKMGGRDQQYVKDELNQASSIKASFGNKRLNETLNNNQVPKEDCIIDSYNKSFHTEVSPSILTTVSSANMHHVKISTNNSKGYDEAEEEEDSINFSVPSSKTRRGRFGKKVSQTLDTQCNQGVFTQQRIRRLTPTECFRLMDFNQEMIEKTINSKLISDSQLYKQAGNSICVGVLAAIISKLKL